VQAALRPSKNAKEQFHFPDLVEASDTLIATDDMCKNRRTFLHAIRMHAT
jgi:hypothetical protein